MRSNPLDSSAEAVVRIFGEALETAAHERASFLVAACAGDEQLLTQIRNLLDASAQAEESDAWSASAIEHEAGASTTDSSSFDRYRLLERIGAGGMGVVYQAVRGDDEYSKLVAIKIVHAPDAAAVRRFRQERQILAGLEHPNIARLLDGGSTPEGLPFLVMEFVDGTPIDRYVAENKLDTRRILALFREICSAVSYAHRNLIVHRDLKPANILVTPDGAPKLLDFGIAKLLDGTSEQTKTGLGAMTPEYSSPEQVRGEAITTASDIYSLGVLLYELLTGVSPYRKTASAMELANAICDEQPNPPGARSGGRFDADLDNIAAMALRKEPDRRYASAEQFSEDIRRYLEGYPVIARADTRGYRAAKFLGRNRAYIAAAALTLVALVGGAAAALWQAHVARQQSRIADQRFNDVRKLANAYLFEFHDAIVDLPGSTPARELVVRRALEYLDRLFNERRTDPGLDRELAMAYEKVGRVQGDVNFPSLGNRAGALASYLKAQAIRERLVAADPANAGLVTDLARINLKAGELLQFSGDITGYAARVRAAIDALERVPASKRGNPEVRDMLSNAYGRLGDVLGNSDLPSLGDLPGAIAAYERSTGIREQLIAEAPTDKVQRLYLGSIYARTGTSLRALGRYPDAARAFSRAITIDGQLVSEEPLNVLYRREVAVYNRTLSLVMLDQGDVAAARQSGDRSAKIFVQLAREDPKNLEAQEALGDSFASQGYVNEHENHWRAALSDYNAAIAVYEANLKARPERQPQGMRAAYQYMAELYLKMGDGRNALVAARKELPFSDVLLRVNSANATAQRGRAIADFQLGRAHELLAEHAGEAVRKSELLEARGWYRQSLDIWTGQQKAGKLIPRFAPKLEEANRALQKCEQLILAASEGR